MKIKNKSPRILIYDIETAPNLGYYFELYKEGNILWNAKHWHMMSFSWKWLGDKKTQVLSLPDFPLYKKDKENDYQLVTELWKLFDEADIIIAHNGNSFDQKKSNSRFIFHKMSPPSSYKEIDTKLVAKRYFKFDSNKLDDLGDYLGVGRKIETGGKELWKRCILGDMKAWKKMCEYNKGDVELLERVYEVLKPWMTNHPNLNIYTGTTHNCPNCGSKKTVKRGFKYTQTGKRQQYQCLDCFSWCSGEKILR